MPQPREAPVDTTYTFVMGTVAEDGQLDELVEAMVGEAAASEDAPGLVGYDILRPFDDTQPVLLVSTWESEDAFDDFMDTAEDSEDRAPSVAGAATTEYESVATFVNVGADDDDDDEDDIDDEAGGADDAGDGSTGSPERMFAVDLFNATWDLLESEERTAEEDRTMLGAALASRLHWRHVGEPKNFSISDWQVSRVFAVLGDVERAKEYGQSALDIASEYGLGPFYVGYAEEALARAAVLEGNGEELSHWLSRAQASLDDIEDEDARSLLAADLDEIAASG